jgi:hypothetical protein
VTVSGTWHFSSVVVTEAARIPPRDGDFDTLLAVLDPDVVLRVARGAVSADTSRAVHAAPTVIAWGFLLKARVGPRACAGST